MYSSLRQRIKRTGGISCKPWKKFWKDELLHFCVSGKTLFRRGGQDFYILERELKEENWICENENLMEVLQSEDRLRQPVGGNFGNGDFPENWTEEDYRYFEEKGW